MLKENETPKNLTLPEVKKLLESLGEENLDQFQRRALNYVTKFSKVKAEKVVKLMETLVNKFELEKERAVQIVNCMPETVDELRVFFAAGRKIIEASKLKAIIILLDEYRKMK